MRICLAAVLAITLWQVLVPPYVGLADNSDFGKISGRFSLVPPGGIFEHHFVYVVGKYAYDPRFYWNSGILSSELIPSGLAVLVHSLWGKGSLFDIRYLGVMHVALVALALLLAMPALRRLDRPLRVAAALLITLALIDVSYVSYWNSFYTDAAALVFLLLVAACGIRMAAAPTVANTCLFGVATVLLATSKLQHAFPSLVFCAYLIWLGWRSPSRPRRAAALAFAGTGLIAVAVLTITAPFFYREKAIFNLIFYEFAAKSPDPRQALREFGLEERHSAALGMHAFEAAYPANDPGWLEDFDKYARFGPILRFYARHPAMVAARLRTVAADNLPEVRAQNLANFRKEDGFPPGTLSRRWTLWSSAQERLYGSVPWAIVPIYVAVIVVALSCRRRFGAPADLMLAFAAFAVAEFLGAGLGDILDTGRHLRVFHAATDLLVIGSLVGAVALRLRSVSASSAGAPPQSL